MPHVRPKFVEVERTAELAVVTFLAVAGTERAKLSAIHRALLALRDVNAAGTVTAFAPDIDQAVPLKFAPIATRTPEADRVATEAVWVGVCLPFDQRRKCMTVPA